MFEYTWNASCFIGSSGRKKRMIHSREKRKHDILKSSLYCLLYGEPRSEEYGTTIPFCSLQTAQFVVVVRAGVRHINHRYRFKPNKKQNWKYTIFGVHRWRRRRRSFWSKLLLSGRIVRSQSVRNPFSALLDGFNIEYFPSITIFEHVLFAHSTECPT